MSLYKSKLNPFTANLQLVSDVANLLTIKGVVAITNDLPLTGNTENDCYIVSADDRLYTWNSSSPTGILSDWVDVGSVTSIDWSAITNKPSSSVANIDDAVSKKHTQNTDTKLDEGGANEVTALEAKEAYAHKSSDGKDHADVVLNNTHRGVVAGNPHAVTKTEVGLSNVENVDTTDADNVDVDVLGTPTYESVKDWMKISQSSGKISGGTFILTNGDGTLLVTAGTGLIRATDSDVADTMFFDWVQNSALGLTDGQTNYIYVDYNDGITPIIGATTTKTFVDNRTKILLGKVYREGTTLHEVEAGMVISELAKRVLTYLNNLNGEIVRFTGLVTTEIGDLNINITEGSGSAGLTPITWSAIDTTGADTFRYWYKDNVGWQDSAVSVINATQYNDYEANPGLVDLTNNNHYGVHFVYMHFEGDVHIVYGTDSYATLAGAELAPTPANLPHIVSDFSLYIGKIIVQKTDTTSFTDVRYPWTDTTTTGLSGVHNDLGGLQGGQADEYYHLTASEYTEATRDATNAQNGLMPSGIKDGYDDAVSKKHTQGTDTTLGAMSVDVNMNTHKLTSLAVPSSNGDSIRATTKITEVNLEDAIDKKHTQNTDEDIILDNAPSVDHTATGIKASFTAGENLVFGDTCYLKSDGKYWKADADAIATGRATAMAIATISADASGIFLMIGVARDDTWAWTVGGAIYLSTTAGAMTQTAPSGTDDAVQILGIATHADRIYFNPSLDVIEHS